ncbi:arginyl-tRNA--protein-N-Asp/Glu arginylyltransferase [Constrictibacter sp. MBR-5]|jgi:arginine-tRNA-protein transferase|uniref:arginyltransferase n=1 Tax=Constrictibacter sp. MBR-5 TaxID=3156467 RepID=UPI0033921525
MKFHPIRPIHQFFATAPVSCPYLSGGAERKLVVELGGPDGEALFADLSRAGFRRSHGFAYRPACRGCRKCVPVRIHVEAFQPTRSLRRVARGNEDLHYAVLPARATREQYRLFLAYQRQRHGSSDMAEMSFADYRDMVEDSPVQTWLVETRDVEGTLVGGLLVDRTADALSAAYSFFDPAQPRRSLGTQAILWLVGHARMIGLPYVYLGYWVDGSATMDYKRRFPAVDALVDGRWQPL